MRLTEQGIIGEQKAREYLKSKGYSLFEIDWIAEKDGECIQVEVKHKEAFEPPPFKGHGMEVWKVNRRLEFENKYGIKAYFLIFDIDGTTYGQYLSELEKGKHFDTRNGIRIYDIEGFNKL